MRARICHGCGSKEVTIARGNYPFKESGLNVVLHGIEIAKCEKCGNEGPIIPRMNGLMRVIALAVISKPYGLRGEEIRFLRKYLGMNGEDFSRLIHVDRTTLSKWENNDDKVGRQSDLLMRSVVLTLGDGLKDKAQELVREFGDISDKHKSKRVEVTVNPETQEYEYA